MKKYIAMFDVIVLLTMGLVMSFHIPMPNEGASGLFAIFEVFYDEEDYGDTKYIAINPEHYEEEDFYKFVFLMRNYCLKNGHKLLVKTYDELVDEGYIVDGGFEDGVIIGFRYIDSSKGNVFAHVYIFKGNLSSYGTKLYATYANREWTIKGTNTIWMS